jgi:outer membrane protein OmpA-like peptidoglycan-associated protein
VKHRAQGLVLGLAACLIGGCGAGNALRQRMDALDTRLGKIEPAAMRCDEHSLAVARANLYFAEVELDQGAYFRAKEHLETATEATRTAEASSAAPGCMTTPDRDGDGIGDAVDQCPDAAEDKDGDRDTDGCPDDGDRDKDTIPDSRDRCPDEPEDKDGDQDEDGCPDLLVDRDGDGIADTADACIDTPEDKDAFEDEDGCPEPDNDKDTVLDVVDKCPLQPEDIDTFEDADGCPDPDTDQDRVADAQDQCPNQPEDYDGDQDTDGCPDLYKNIIVRDDRIELKQTVYFATAKDRILPKSYPLLNEVALALRDNPNLFVRIEGHTDSQGAAAANQRLSQKRAESVRRYLIDQAIAPTRMEAEGFGEDRPLEDNRTAEGRAANRRVEFHIIKK